MGFSAFYDISSVFLGISNIRSCFSPSSHPFGSFPFFLDYAQRLLADISCYLVILYINVNYRVILLYLRCTLSFNCCFMKTSMVLLVCLLLYVLFICFSSFSKQVMSFGLMFKVFASVRMYRNVVVCSFHNKMPKYVYCKSLLFLIYCSTCSKYIPDARIFLFICE